MNYLQNMIGMEDGGWQTGSYHFFMFMFDKLSIKIYTHLRKTIRRTGWILTSCVMRREYVAA